MNKMKILPATIATILATGMVASSMTSALAMGSESSKATANMQVAKKDTAQMKDEKNKAAEEDLVKVSEDAQISLSDLRSARLAIFDGDPARAQTYVDAARTRIEVANTEADKYALDIKAPKKADLYVPFDTTMMVLDTYAPTDEKAKSIARANKHLHMREHKKALETLKLNDINVAVSTGLVPVKFARDYIDKASTLVRQGKYYEANLALKEVDDAVVIHTFDADHVPKIKAEKNANKEKSAG